jgi:hypothetical protein
MDQKLAQGKSLYPDQPYKEQWFRDDIARRYGIELLQTKTGYNEPRLMKREVPKPIFQIYQERYSNGVSSMDRTS